MTEDELREMLRGISTKSKFEREAKYTVDPSFLEDANASPSSSSGGSKDPAKRFLLRNPENSDLNQYWFSPKTIAAIVAEAEESCMLELGEEALLGAALLSTPSIHFSMSENTRAMSRFFDFDRQWEKDPGFIFYDFNDPLGLPAELHHKFRIVVIDPPFITRDVWSKYAETAKFLVAPGGRILGSTVPENVEWMGEVLPGIKPRRYQPSIPNLVYQYCMWANYDSERMDTPNDEIPECDRTAA